MNFKDLKIGTRLTAGIVLAALLLALLVVTGLGSMGSIKAELSLITQDRMPKIALGHNVKENLYERAVITRNIVMLEDAPSIQQMAQRLA